MWAPHGTALVTGGTGAIGGHWPAGWRPRCAPRVVLASRSGPADGGVAATAAALATAGTGVDRGGVMIAPGRERAGRAGGLRSTQRVHSAGMFGGAATPPGDRASQPRSPTRRWPSLGCGASRPRRPARRCLHRGDRGDRSGRIRPVLLRSPRPGEAALSFSVRGGEQPIWTGWRAPRPSWAWRRPRSPGACGAAAAWVPARAAGQLLERHGLRQDGPCSSRSGRSARHWTAGETQLTIADVDWARFAPPFTLRRPSPLIENLPEVPQVLAEVYPSGPQQTEAATELVQRLARLPRAEQEQELQDLIRFYTRPRCSGTPHRKESTSR